jgi:uncharacterized protein YjbI with pentapeptide repeats
VSAPAIVKLVSRWDSKKVLWEGEAASIAEAVKKARAADADLGGADLGGADLGDADLGGADLGGADLGGADLGDAYLGGAYLGGADLRGAYLGGAYLGGADLRGAYLGGADLGGADLGDAYLGGAYLGGADLGDAYLGGAYLGGADLRGAYLGCADLGGAYLGGAYLGGADLRGAYLGCADLGDADLGGADLGGADLRGADQEDLKKRGAIFDGSRPGPKEDIFAVLDQAPAEVPALLDALRQGRVNGTVYEGDCACLVGTIANARGCNYQLVGIETDPSRPAERWFYSIRPGRTPDKSSKVRRTIEWIEEWQAARIESAPTVQP